MLDISYRTNTRHYNIFDQNFDCSLRMFRNNDVSITFRISVETFLYDKLYSKLVISYANLSHILLQRSTSWNVIIMSLLH